jgi:uncharacterized protein YdcH (DUF465 family)
MSHTPNQLDEDFPGMAERMHALKTSNNRFARLVEEYNELNREIHRVETRVEPTSEDVEEELKRRRVRLKDEIAQMLDDAEVTRAEASRRGGDMVNAPRMRGGF